MAVTAAEIITAFPLWAARDPRVAGVFLVGSHARGEATTESDVDFVLLTSLPEKYIDDTRWVRRFGDPLSVVLEDWGKVRSVRVHYASGLEVEFGVTTPDWASYPVPMSTQEVLTRGMQLLYDRSGELKYAINNMLEDC